MSGPNPAGTSGTGGASEAIGATRRVLILALGGEGGGVLVEWLVKAAQHCSYPVQSTSIPGVAQRTGATSYYLECLPQTLADDAMQPVFCLSPMAGELDLLVSTELLETARALERALTDPVHTRLISSSARVLTVAEKMPMADGRRNAHTLVSQVRALHPGAVLFDMQAAASEAGTIVSAVMFGAIAASGVLGLPREVCERVIGASGRGVRASLVGFEAGFVAAQAQAQASTLPAATVAQPCADASAPPSDLVFKQHRLPAALADIVRHGYERVADFQDEALAREYLDRVVAYADLERAADAGSECPVACKAARHLALWSAYEDVIRVADLKSRAQRFDKIRAEVAAQPGEPVIVSDFLKPGVAELADILPPRPAAWLQRRFGQRALGQGLRLPANRLLGLLAMRLLAALRPWRRASSRFASEQALIQRWDFALRSALAADTGLGSAIAGLPRLLKGYGATHRRGRSNFLKILETLIEPAAGEADQRARAIQAAIDAALADPEGRALAAVLGHEPPAPPEQAIRFMRKSSPTERSG